MAPREVKLPGQRRRQIAARLLQIHLAWTGKDITFARSDGSSVHVVCISDTHNKHPTLPPGDILIHAGDLTENGSFDEIQNNLDWLASQPHQHKVPVAGNHDVLLDPTFLDHHPRYGYDDARTRHDLRWPDGITYLENSSTILDITSKDGRKRREVKIFGSPFTPQYTVSAFQYPANEADDVWSGRIPADTDIIITHGPPRLHLDQAGARNAGCAALAEEISRVRPRLHVFGHIHVGYGRQDVVLDVVQRRYERIINHRGGWVDLVVMAFGTMNGKVQALLHPGASRLSRCTTYVNAAIVGGSDNEIQNAAQVITI